MRRVGFLGSDGIGSMDRSRSPLPAPAEDADECIGIHARTTPPFSFLERESEDKRELSFPMHANKLHSVTNMQNIDILF